MNARDIEQLVIDQIADRWDETNLHGVDLRLAIVAPTQSQLMLHTVDDGEVSESIVDVWIVLRELTEGDGYLIFYDVERAEFGLASVGDSAEKQPVICGYYGDFWTTFRGM